MIKMNMECRTNDQRISKCQFRVCNFSFDILRFKIEKSFTALVAELRKVFMSTALVTLVKYILKIVVKKGLKLESCSLKQTLI